MVIPFLNFAPTHQLLKQEMQAAFESIYDSNWYILGNHLSSFEQLYCEFNQVRYTIGVSNGLDALHLALKIAGVQRGDEVIVPSNTYIATWLAVSYLDAVPVPVEPNIETYNLDPAKIEAAISAKTKAIMPVHLYGQACEMDRIKALANKYHLKVIEDNAQAQGASFKGKITGSFGDINATSFYPGKNLGALGDAGAITTDSEEYALRARRLRNYGSEKKYYNEEIGHNMRLDELQAAFLTVKLKRLKEWTVSRQQIAKWYDQYLKQIGDLVLPVVADHATHVYHLYVIRTNQRNALQQYLQSKGVGTLIHYPVPPHLQNAYHYLGYQRGSFPIAEVLADTMLSLPLWVGMEEQHVAYIAKSINDFFEQ
jgi:dTDP-4-amino-4,6-dideoxygalactose transaminase